MSDVTPTPPPDEPHEPPPEPPPEGAAEAGSDTPELEDAYLQWLDEPIEAGRRLIRRAMVRLPRTGRLQLCDARDVSVGLGDLVIIDQSGSQDLGKVSERPTLVLHDGPAPPRVLRLASRDDERKDKNREARETEAFDKGRAAVRRHRLRMKLVSAHWQFGRNQVTFYFGAEGRVDFREMARELGRDLRARVEMRQVGARDESRLTGGVGICGLELCCSSWLQGFEPVSIRHAKSQNLALNTEKLQGVCGRLMCCLVYEHESYKEMRKGLPKVGKIIETPGGEARVREVDIPRRRVRVQTGATTFQVYEAYELGIDPPPQKEEPEPEPEPEPMPQRIRSSDRAEEKGDGRGSGRRRRGGGGGGQPGGESKAAGGGESTGEGGGEGGGEEPWKKSSSRRRRGGRRRGGRGRGSGGGGDKPKGDDKT